MSLIKGFLYFSRDLNQAIMQMHQYPSTRCLFVGDTMGKYDSLLDQYGIISASILMPDIIGMEADINGTPDEFRDKYFNYLNSDAPKSMIVTIITALYQGKNIILLVPPEANGLNYPMVLLNYFSIFHGINAGCVETGTMFTYNPAADVTNADYMYMFNIIGPSEYLFIAGPNFDMIDKLCHDTNTSIPLGTPPEVVKNYFEQWRQNMINSGTQTSKVFGFSIT